MGCTSSAASSASGPRRRGGSGAVSSIRLIWNQSKVVFRSWTSLGSTWMASAIGRLKSSPSMKGLQISTTRAFWTRVGLGKTQTSEQWSAPSSTRTWCETIGSRSGPLWLGSAPARSTAKAITLYTPNPDQTTFNRASAVIVTFCPLWARSPNTLRESRKFS